MGAFQSREGEKERDRWALSAVGSRGRQIKVGSQNTRYVVRSAPIEWLLERPLVKRVSLAVLTRACLSLINCQSSCKSKQKLVNSFS